MTYEFPEKIQVTEVPKNVPAELLLGILDDTKVYFSYPSTFMQEIRTLDPKILFASSKQSDTYNPTRILDSMKTIDFGPECLVDIDEENVKDRT